jgi:hypothetical protein
MRKGRRIEPRKVENAGGADGQRAGLRCSNRDAGHPNALIQRRNGEPPSRNAAVAENIRQIIDLRVNLI